METSSKTLAAQGVRRLTLHPSPTILGRAAIPAALQPDMRPGRKDESVIVTWRRWTTVLMSLLLAAACVPCLAADAAAVAAFVPPPVPATPAPNAEPQAPPEPAPAALHLVVRHALDSGRLVVRVGQNAFLSAPLKVLRGAAPGHGERLLSVPGGEQTITVQWFDGQGRFLAQKQTHADVSAAAPAILDVAAAMVSGVANLSVSWRERP